MFAVFFIYGSIMYFLGLDGGGTKTEAVLTDLSGNQLRRAEGGPGNVSTLGQEGVKELISNLIENLLKGEPLSHIQNATLCFAGIGRVQEKYLMSDLIASLGLTEFNLKTDAEILHFAAFDEEDGIVLEAGTGAVCVIKSGGKLKQFGGWGYLLGDDGGGYSIGRYALRKVLAEIESDQPLSDFSAQIMNHFKVKMPEEIITKVYGAESSQMLIASCAKLVSSLALSRIQEANVIITEAAKSLYNLVINAVESAKIKPPYSIALAGSVLGLNSPVQDQFKELASKSSFDFNYSDILYTSAEAALIHAIKNSGEAISDSLQLKLREPAI